MRNVLTIGDVHGRLNWKDIIFGSLEKYEDWRNDLVKGSTLSWEETVDSAISDIDKIVFLGDYHDSYTVSNLIIKHNFLDILFFKRYFPERVILLWGNHDAQYYWTEERCSGFRPEMLHDFGEILRENFERLQFAYQEGNVIWTHAGITNYFYEKICRKTSLKLSGIDKLSLEKLASFINVQSMHRKWDPLFNVGKLREGFDNIPGPLWADKRELLADPLPGMIQVVGHTPVHSPEFYKEESLLFCDALERGYSVIVEIDNDKFSGYQILERGTFDRS
jgi:hypothetical protein